MLIGSLVGNAKICCTRKVNNSINYFNFRAFWSFMTKPAIVIDLDGALLKSRPFDTAHKEWFRIMGELIKDYSINEFAFKPDYYEHVNDIMKKYLGDIDAGTRNAFARNIFAMGIVESVKKWDLIDIQII